MGKCWLCVPWCHYENIVSPRLRCWKSRCKDEESCQIQVRPQAWGAGVHVGNWYGTLKSIHPFHFSTGEGCSALTRTFLSSVIAIAEPPDDAPEMLNPSNNPKNGTTRLLVDSPTRMLPLSGVQDETCERSALRHSRTTFLFQICNARQEHSILKRIGKLRNSTSKPQTKLQWLSRNGFRRHEDYSRLPFTARAKTSQHQNLEICARRYLASCSREYLLVFDG